VLQVGDGRGLSEESLACLRILAVLIVEEGPMFLVELAIESYIVVSCGGIVLDSSYLLS